MRVQNMTSANGNKVANQFIIEDSENNATYFQSYNTIIAKRQNGVVTLDESKWDYSNTTGKYRNQFLMERKPETLKKIESGEYKLGNLN